MPLEVGFAFSEQKMQTAVGKKEAFSKKLWQILFCNSN